MTEFAGQDKLKTVLNKIMAKAITYKGKTVITADGAANGYRLLDTSEDFAFVKLASEDVIHAIPVKKNLKLSDITFDALDFLKFREGFLEVGDIWKYIMILNGIYRISILSTATEICFVKMREADWKEILPPLKDMLEFVKFQLLHNGSFEVRCPHCHKTLGFEHDEQQWIPDESHLFYFATECSECRKEIEVVVDGDTDLYYASEITYQRSVCDVKS